MHLKYPCCVSDGAGPRSRPQAAQAAPDLACSPAAPCGTGAPAGACGNSRVQRRYIDLRSWRTVRVQDGSEMTRTVRLPAQRAIQPFRLPQLERNSRGARHSQCRCPAPQKRSRQPQLQENRAPQGAKQTRKWRGCRQIAACWTGSLPPGRRGFKYTAGTVCASLGQCHRAPPRPLPHRPSTSLLCLHASSHASSYPPTWKKHLRCRCSRMSRR